MQHTLKQSVIRSEDAGPGYASEMNTSHNTYECQPKKRKTPYDQSLAQIMSIRPDSSTYIPVFSISSSEMESNASLRACAANERRNSSVIGDEPMPIKKAKDVGNERIASEYELIISSLEADLLQARQKAERSGEAAQEHLERASRLEEELNAASNCSEREQEVIAELEERVDEVTAKCWDLQQRFENNANLHSELQSEHEEAKSLADELRQQVLYLEAQNRLNWDELELTKKKLEFATRQNIDLLQISEETAMEATEIDELRATSEALVIETREVGAENAELKKRLVEMQEFEAVEENELSYAADEPEKLESNPEIDDAVGSELGIIQQISELQRVLLDNEQVIDALGGTTASENSEIAELEDQAEAAELETATCKGTITELEEELENAYRTIARLEEQLEAEHIFAQNINCSISNVVARGIDSLMASETAQDGIAVQETSNLETGQHRMSTAENAWTQTDGEEIEQRYAEAMEQLALLTEQLNQQRILTEAICEEMVHFPGFCGDPAEKDGESESKAPSATQESAVEASTGESESEREITLLKRRIERTAEHYARQQELDLAEISQTRNELSLAQKTQVSTSEQLKRAQCDKQRLENLVSDLEFQLSALSDEDVQRRIQGDARTIAFLKEALCRLTTQYVRFIVI